MTDELAICVAKELRRLARGASRCLLAVSGGADSVAMLELLARTRDVHCIDLIVAHVDHGIASDHGEVMESVRAAAGARGLEFVCRQLELGREATETRAREARRWALRRMATETGAGIIATAHHADDQTETVIMRLMKGSSPAGLAGMRRRSGVWVRPLLKLRRDQLRRVLSDAGITWCEDPANADPRHLRSWLRQEVMPLMAQRDAQLVRNVTRAARELVVWRDGWDDVIQLLPGLSLQHDPYGISVAAQVLLGYRSHLRQALLGALCRRVSAPAGPRTIGTLDRLLLRAHGRADLARGVVAEMAFGKLALYRTRPVASAVSVNGPAALRFDAFGFSFEPADFTDVVRADWQTAIEPDRYLIRGWRAGDAIEPLGGQGHRGVSTLLREARVAVTQRPHWPVLVRERDATIVWVPGICRAKAAVPPPGSGVWRVKCAVA